MNGIKRHAIPILFLCLCAYLVYTSWFHDTGILTDGDWYTLEKDSISEYVAWPALWSSAVNTGSTVLVMSFYPISLLMGLLGLLGLDFSSIERIVFMIPIIFFSLIGMYSYAYQIFHSRSAAMTSAIVFFFNTYAVLGRTGHLTLMAASALMPFTMLFYSRLIESFTRRDFVVTTILLACMSFFEFRIFYIFTLMLLGYCIFVPKNVFEISWHSLKTHVLRFSPLITVAAIHSTWLFAYSQMGSGLDTQFFHRVLFGNAFMSLERAITLFHPFWTGAGLATFVVQDIPIYFWIIPFIAFSGLYFGRKNKVVLWYGLVACVSIILAKQVDVPFPKLYEWLFEEFPGFVAFREASKFYGVIGFAYAILIGSLIAKLWKSDHRKYLHVFQYVPASLVTCLIGALFIYNAAPLINGDIKELLQPHARPNDYARFNENLGNDPHFSRTLWVPTWSRWSYYTEVHPRVNYQDLLYGEITHAWKNASPTATLTRDEVWNQSFSNQFFDLLSIKYVIVPMEETYDSFFKHYGKRDSFIQTLKKATYLEEIQGVYSNIHVFENKDYRPHIYTTESEDTLRSPARVSEVAYVQKSPTHYEVTLDHIAATTYLYFTDAYHSDWMLSLHDSWISNFFFDRPLPGVTHRATDTRTQMFIIKPEIIKQDIPDSLYKKHSDGSITMKVSLHFVSQRYMMRWIIGLVVILVLVKIGFLLKRRI